MAPTPHTAQDRRNHRTDPHFVYASIVATMFTLASVLLFFGKQHDAAAFTGCPTPACAGRTVCAAKFFYTTWAPPEAYAPQMNQFQLVVFSHIDQMRYL